MPQKSVNVAATQRKFTVTLPSHTFPGGVNSHGCILAFAQPLLTQKIVGREK